MATIEINEKISAYHIQMIFGSTHQSKAVDIIPTTIIIPSHVLRFALRSALAPRMGQIMAIVTAASEFIHAHSALPVSGETEPT